MTRYLPPKQHPPPPNATLKPKRQPNSWRPCKTGNIDRNSRKDGQDHSGQGDHCIGIRNALLLNAVSRSEQTHTCAVKCNFTNLPAAMYPRFILSLAAVMLLTAFSGNDPDSWSIDMAHSKIGFKVRHLGISNVRGDFGEYDATITMDGEDLSTVAATVTIQVASINTSNERRDNHLRSDDFFSAEAFPTMTFESTGVTNVDGSTFELVGNLTIRDVMKEIVLNAEYLGSASMGDSERAGFEARTTVNRTEYGLMWNRLTEAGGAIVGHDVEIILELELVKDA